MRIVNQERTKSADFNVAFVSVYEQGEKGYISINYADFGKYDSLARAKEVFEDIHKAYAPVYSISNGLTKEQIKNGFVGSKNIIANNIRTESTDYCITTYESYVYYMPEN